MTDDPVIQTHGLTRYFGKRSAVDGVDLVVPRGSVYAMLGRNGSGKSTLIQMLLGLLPPTRGTATVFGQPSTALSPDVIGRIGYLPESHPLPGRLTVRDLLAFQRSYYAEWDDAIFSAVIEHFSLQNTQRAGTLSRGQRAGLALALVLATHPELLVMDDPSLGLDPVARSALLEAMLLATRQRGTTIFFTSHQLDDVERSADYIGILDRSVLRVSCSLQTLDQRVRRFRLICRSGSAAVLAMPNVLQSQQRGEELQLTIANPTHEILQAMQAASLMPMEEVPMSLQDRVLGYLGDQKHQTSLLDRIDMTPKEVA